MNKNFFWKKAAELKTNTEWYRKTEAEIRERIKETQKILKKEPENKMAQFAIRLYSNFLDSLLANKAETVSKIGKSSRRS